MQKNACRIEPKNNHQLATVSELVGALTQDQHQQLRDFATRRLKRSRRWPQLARLLAGKTPDDLVNNAIAKYLMGETHPKMGWLLSTKGRHSIEAFVHFLTAAVNSEIQNLRTSAEAAGVFMPVSEAGEAGTVILTEPLDPMKLLERRDLRRVMFERLEKVIAQEPSLAPVIRYWSEHFEGADRIAGPEFDENLVRRVRQHARRILCELAVQIQPHSPTGIEMLF